MIVDRAAILTFLGKASSITDQDDGFLAMIQPMVEMAVQRAVGYSIAQTTHTHYLPVRTQGAQMQEGLHYDVRGNRAVLEYPTRGLEATQLLLQELPVRSITSVNEDPGAYGGQGASDFSGSDLTAGVDYWLDQTESGISRSAILHKTGGSWSSAARTVKVVYVAGYTQTELSTGIAAPLQLAVLLGIRAQFAQRGQGVGAIKSEKLGDWAATYAVPDEGGGVLPRPAKKIIQPFVSYARFM